MTHGAELMHRVMVYLGLAEPPVTRASPPRSTIQRVAAACWPGGGAVLLVVLLDQVTWPWALLATVGYVAVIAVLAKLADRRG